MKTKKVIKALKVLKKYCKKNDGCGDCVFKCGKYVLVCELSDILPNSWDIKSIKEKLKDIETL